MPFEIWTLIVLALVFNFLNGFHDSSNIVATMISSRSISPRKALVIAAVAEFCGPFLFGVAVARVIGTGLVPPESITLNMLYASLGAAILWNVLTWLLGIPSSSSHALIGGLLGAALLQVGTGGVNLGGLETVLIALFISPPIGLLVGFLVMRLVLFLASNATPRINWFFKRVQVLTAISLALSHGANDAQKTMGVLALGLVAGGVLAQFTIPLWVILACSATISLGTLAGGWRLIRTLGGRFYKIRPVHAFTSQLASTAVILTAALLGGPVSTTQVVSSSILGVGSAERINKVRWGVAGDIAWAWLLTIPASALLSAGLFLVLSRLN